ncbi:MAG: glutamate racemase [Steroidobacteraceae bacterium]
MPRAVRDLPVGVFDSGVGGLTVLAALRARLPRENYLYLGDTARLPYGTKTAGTVERYALQAVEALVARGVKAVVVACNTASAAALPALRERFADLPVIGVIEPGAAAASAASRSGRIAVIATESTVRGGAYQRAIAALRPQAHVNAVAAGLFVALAEEGWLRGSIVEAVAQRYLEPLFADAREAPDTLVLGCTHFPPLLEAIRRVVGAEVAIVDSADTTARALQERLIADALLRGTSADGGTQFFVTDGVERFLRTGPVFLGAPIDAQAVGRLDLQWSTAEKPQAGNS